MQRLCSLYQLGFSLDVAYKTSAFFPMYVSFGGVRTQSCKHKLF